MCIYYYHVVRALFGGINHNKQNLSFLAAVDRIYLWVDGVLKELGPDPALLMSIYMVL